MIFCACAQLTLPYLTLSNVTQSKVTYLNTFLSDTHLWVFYIYAYGMGGRVPIRLYQELVASAYLSFVIPSLMVFEFGGG